MIKVDTNSDVAGSCSLSCRKKTWLSVDKESIRMNHPIFKKWHDCFVMFWKTATRTPIDTCKLEHPQVVNLRKVDNTCRPWRCPCVRCFLEQTEERDDKLCKDWIPGKCNRKVSLLTKSGLLPMSSFLVKEYSMCLIELSKTCIAIPGWLFSEVIRTGGMLSDGCSIRNWQRKRVKINWGMSGRTGRHVMVRGYVVGGKFWNCKERKKSYILEEEDAWGVCPGLSFEQRAGVEVSVGGWPEKVQRSYKSKFPSPLSFLFHSDSAFCVYQVVLPEVFECELFSTMFGNLCRRPFPSSSINLSSALQSVELFGVSGKNTGRSAGTIVLNNGFASIELCSWRGRHDDSSDQENLEKVRRPRPCIREILRCFPVFSRCFRAKQNRHSMTLSAHW